MTCSYIMWLKVHTWLCLSKAVSCGTGEYDEAKIQADCKKQFGIGGDADWSVISLGGMDWSSASNIVFSNGEYDPWKIGRPPCYSKSLCH